MKTKEILRLIFVNPFEKIAGWQALGLGLIAVILTALIGSYYGGYFNGAIDFSPKGNSYPLWIALAMLAISITSIIIMFLLAGVIFSKNFRVIDVVGTVTLAKASCFFLALTVFIPKPALLNDVQAIVKNPDILLTSFVFWIDFFISILLVIWFIALLYNAFVVSLNIRKNLRVVVFIFALLFAEILSKVLLKTTL